jgi:hypothetical protein
MALESKIQRFNLRLLYGNLGLLKNNLFRLAIAAAKAIESEGDVEPRA